MQLPSNTHRAGIEECSNNWTLLTLLFCFNGLRLKFCGDAKFTWFRYLLHSYIDAVKCRTSVWLPTAYRKPFYIFWRKSDSAYFLNMSPPYNHQVCNFKPQGSYVNLEERATVLWLMFLHQLAQTVKFPEASVVVVRENGSLCWVTLSSWFCL